MFLSGAWPRRQRGQSMTEFIIVWPVLVLLVFGTLQLILIYLAKSTLNYATFEATRAGTLNQARREEVDLGFIRGMAPMYTTHIRSVNDAREKIEEEINDGNVCIERINPTSSAFDEFADADNQIPNDNLMFRDPAVQSGTTIQEANLLKIRVTYCYELIVPIINRLIPQLMEAGGLTGGSYEQRCWEQNRIPIKAQGILRMQSAAIQDAGFDSSCD